MKRIVSRIWESLLKSTVVIITIWIVMLFQLSINAGEGIIVTGVVETSMLDDGDITSVIIDSRLDNGEIYDVVLNAVGKKLGQEMNGNWVEVIGSVRKEGGKNWVEVKKFEKAEPVE
jgi:hypothetical protein